MSANESKTIHVACPCCEAVLTIDPALAVVLEHKLPAKPPVLAQLKDAVAFIKEEAGKRDEKFKQFAEAEKNKSAILEAKTQELFKKAKEEPLEKPLKDIDLD